MTSFPEVGAVMMLTTMIALSLDFGVDAKV
jgi:hypothetical protein